MSDVTDDTTMNAMAMELHGALIRAGADPKDPPQGGPPSARAFQEYQQRGGTQYTDADEFTAALIERVKAI